MHHYSCCWSMDPLDASFKPATVFMMTARSIRKERNARLFDQRLAPVSLILDRIKGGTELWVAAGARKLGRLFCE
jgi:hypothetical protein